jgi:hypothetical protein
MQNNDPLKNESDRADVLRAVFALREAAQAHGRVEAEVGDMPDPQSRDVLLDAKLDMEAKTAQAIDACVHCGRVHADACDPESS